MAEACWIAKPLFPTGKNIKAWGGVRFVNGTPGMTAYTIALCKRATIVGHLLRPGRIFSTAS